MVVVVVDGLWLVVLWWWTLGIVDRLLMNFDLWDVGDKVQTIGPKVELTLSDWLLGIGMILLVSRRVLTIVLPRWQSRR